MRRANDELAIGFGIKFTADTTISIAAQRGLKTSNFPAPDHRQVPDACHSLVHGFCRDRRSTKQFFLFFHDVDGRRHDQQKFLGIVRRREADDDRGGLKCSAAARPE